MGTAHALMLVLVLGCAVKVGLDFFIWPMGARRSSEHERLLGPTLGD